MPNSGSGLWPRKFCLPTEGTRARAWRIAGTIRPAISQIRDSDSTGQAPLYCGLHQVRSQERERNRHIDLTDGAVFSGSDLLDICDHSRINSSSQCRPFAIALMSMTRVSERMGRGSGREDVAAGGNDLARSF
jgi:hypothetical protein